jgi:glutaredoxin
MTLPISALILLALGVLVLLVGGIMVLVAAFRQSIVWGLVSLFVPCGNLVFTVAHWAEAKKGTIISLLGVLPIAGAAFMVQGELRKVMAGAGPLGMIAATGAPQKDLTAQIAEKRAQIEVQDVAFAQDGAELAPQYAALEARRIALKPGDAEALAKFNADAALYQARTTKRKQMFAEIETARRELDALLEERARSAKRVVMYSTSRCPACVSAKQYFAQKGVSYQEIDLEKSPDGRAAFEKLGGRGVPLIMVGEKRMEGFSAQALDAML